MNLDKLQLELKPRNYWQAIDLGLRVTRHYLRPLLMISLVMTSVVLLLAYALSQNPLYSCLLLFWFKPLIERPLLFYISRAIFSDNLSLRELFSQLPDILAPQWLKTFSLYRVSLSRSFNEPVVMLEQQKNEKRAKRLDLLSRENDGAVWLTLFALACEMLLYAGLLLLPLLLLPGSPGKIFDSVFFNDSQALGKGIYFMLLYALTIALIAPFYSVCGFVLYLNRRTQLEAWHIELGFRKLAKRFSNSSSALLLLLTLGIFSLVQPQPIQAQPHSTAPLPSEATAADTELSENNDPDSESEAEELSHDERYPLMQQPEAVAVREEITALLSSDTFGEHYQKAELDIDWEIDWDWSLDDSEAQDNSDWLEAIQQMLSYFKMLVILLLVSLLSWVLIHYRPWQYLPAFARSQEEIPDQVMGFDVKKDSLPDNVLTIIQQLITQGNFREALSMMFRCHLSKAIRNHHVPFKTSSTEQECQQLMHEYCGADEADVFAQLVQTWQQLAYAHRTLSEQQLQQLYHRWTPLIRGQI